MNQKQNELQHEREVQIFRDRLRTNFIMSTGGGESVGYYRTVKIGSAVQRGKQYINTGSLFWSHSPNRDQLWELLGVLLGHLPAYTVNRQGRWLQFSPGQDGFQLKITQSGMDARTITLTSPEAARVGGLILEAIQANDRLSQTTILAMARGVFRIVQH